MPPIQTSTWHDLPSRTLQAVAPDPAAVNSQAASTTPFTSRALTSLIAILVHPAANSLPHGTFDRRPADCDCAANEDAVFGV